MNKIRLRKYDYLSFLKRQYISIIIALNGYMIYGRIYGQENKFACI